MSAPLDSQTYPSKPTSPSAAPAGYVTPTKLSSGNAPPVTPEQIASRRGNFIELIVREVVKAFTGFFFPGSGPAVDQLITWVTVTLPSLILQPIYQLVDFLIDVLDLIPVFGSPAGNILEYLAGIFGYQRDKTATAQTTGEQAQASADAANVAISRLEGKDAASEVPGGIWFDDTFDRTSGSSLGSDYDQASSGAPTGALQTEGNNAWWNVGGNGQGSRFARITTPLFTIYQGIQVVLNAPLKNMNVADPHVRILLRCNTARTHYVYVDIKYNLVEVFKVIGGNATSLGSAALPNPSAVGDRWTFKAGTDVLAGGSDDEFVVYQNTAEALRVLDSGTLASKGTGYEYGGFALVNGQIQVGFGNVVQDPPKVQSVTLYDRLPEN